MTREDFNLVLNGIEAGTFDSELKEIEEAVRHRQQARREAVLAQVEEVFGPNYQVIAHRDRDFTKGGQTTRGISSGLGEHP